MLPLSAIFPNRYNKHNQDNSQHASDIALYYASADDRETLFCLFVHQEMKEDKKTL